jgi:hypothetical protein
MEEPQIDLAAEFLTVARAAEIVVIAMRVLHEAATATESDGSSVWADEDGWNVDTNGEIVTVHVYVWDRGYERYWYAPETNVETFERELREFIAEARGV